MDTFYRYMCLCVDVDVCVCIQQEVMEHGQRASVPSCLVPSAPTFLVSKFTQPKLCVSELSQNTKNHQSISKVGKGFVVSQRAFRCDDTKASFEVLSFPSSLTFTPSSYSLLFFSSGWWGWFRHSSGCLQTEVYFQGLSQ